jgi:hypothetical protein
MHSTNDSRQADDSSSFSHVLDIHMYKFNEILNLFDLTENITENDMKQAKKKVLMMHPDKSKLPSQYFLFYKKAYEIVYHHYNNIMKMKHSKEYMSQQNVYMPHETSIYDRKTNEKITENLNKMNSKVFNHKFNELFEKNMKSSEIEEKKKAKNEWFYKEDPLYSVDNKDRNINRAIEHVKQNQQMGLIQYKGVQELYSRGGTKLFEEDEDGEEEDGDIYVSSDLFGKLKYDDLRKVHKDQTVFAVSEKDYDAIPKYQNIEQYQSVRVGNLTPMEKEKAEKMLQDRDRYMKNKLANKHFQSTLKNEKYIEMNKNVLSSFLMIEK